MIFYKTTLSQAWARFAAFDLNPALRNLKLLQQAVGGQIRKSKKGHPYLSAGRLSFRYNTFKKHVKCFTNHCTGLEQQKLYFPTAEAAIKWYLDGGWADR